MRSSSPSVSFGSKVATLLCCPLSPPSMASNLLNFANSYYMLLRELFSRLSVSLQIKSSLSMEIIAFWLWLKGNGHDDLLERIDSLDDDYVRVIASCATTFLEALHIELIDSDDRSTPRSHFQREAMEGISFYLNNVCYKAFKDHRERAVTKEFIHGINEVYGESLNDRVPVSTEHLLTKIKALYANSPKHHGEGTSSRSIHVQTSRILLPDINEAYECQSTSRLVTFLNNLSLREKHNDEMMQQLSDVPRDERTLFVTFSNGYPLTKDELHHFFMRHYGDIEEISIEEPVEHRPPLYAHVTFFSQLTLLRVLDGNKRVKFMIRGKHLWARQFVPKKKRKLNPDELNLIA